MVFWPLFALIFATVFYLIARIITIRGLRPILAATLGWCAIAGGASLVALLSIGLVELSSSDLVAAQDKAADSTASSEPVAESSAVSAAPATPAPATQPEIKLDASGTIPLASSEETKPELVKPEDIKIETLPDGTIVIPAGRPHWVESKALLTGSIHAVPVSSGPHKLTRDAQRALDEAMKRATDEYVGDQVGSPLAAKFIPYSLDTIEQRFVKQTYNETVNFESVGPMEYRHALLQFDDNFRNEIRHTWAGRIAESRLYQVGLGAGAALLLLSSVFGYFRLDNATRGYYTGRLQFLTAAAILTVVALGAAAAFQFTWL